MLGNIKTSIISVIIWLSLIVSTAILFKYSYTEQILSSVPWIRNSILLAINTIGWSWAGCYARATGNIKESTLSAFLFSLLIAPFAALMVIPTYDDFGSSVSDHILQFLIGICILHGLGFLLIEKTQDKFIDKEN